MNDLQLLNTAFEQLRSAGVFAQGDLECCNTCALDEIPDDTDFVFWHGQDNESFNPSGDLIKTLHLGWGGDVESIVRVLKEHLGDRVSHNGDENRKIEIVPW